MTKKQNPIGGGGGGGGERALPKKVILHNFNVSEKFTSPKLQIPKKVSFHNFNVSWDKTARFFTECFSKRDIILLKCPQGSVT